MYKTCVSYNTPSPVIEDHRDISLARSKVLNEKAFARSLIAYVPSFHSAKGKGKEKKAK